MKFIGFRVGWGVEGWYNYGRSLLWLVGQARGVSVVTLERSLVMV